MLHSKRVKSLTLVRGRTMRRLRRFCLTAAVIASAGLYAALQWPVPFELRPQQSGWALDRNGKPLSELLDAEAVRSGWVGMDKIPEALVGAVLAAEDGRFYRHYGVDPLALARAVMQNLRARRIVSGGSTVSQQLARLVWPRPRTFGGKLREALRALRLEAALTKDEILEQYLNRAPFGNQLYGVRAAARVYLDKSVETLTPAECAFLAALPRAPGWLNPYRRPEPVIRRQAAILRRMGSLGWLGPAELQAALDERLDLKDTRGLLRAPHFVRQVLSRHGPILPGQSLRTTLDLELQGSVEAILRHTLGSLRSRNVRDGAVVVLDTRTREVLAWAGSPDFARPESGQNDGVLALRQPGSALKPFTYLVALQGRFTPSSLLTDLPTDFASDVGTYSPENYDGRFHGPVRLRVALASSLNVPAVQVAEQVGPAAILRSLRALGMGSLDREADYYGLALTLGSGEVRLLDLTNAYATLAAHGRHLPVRLLADGRPAGPRSVLDPAAAALVLDILSDDSARALSFGVGSVLELPFPAAVKTGTSKNFRDNWCVGATPEVTVGVWVGNFDGEPMAYVSGITGAGPIWRQVMQAAMAGRARLPISSFEGTRLARICPVSGELAGPLCASAIDERFMDAKVPAQLCSIHQERTVTLGAEELADPACPQPGDHRRSFEVYPPRFRGWARGAGRPVPPERTRDCPQPAHETAGGAAVRAPPGALRVLAPVHDGVYALDPGIPEVFQNLRMRAAAPEGRRLEWLLNGEPIGDGVSTLHWPVRRGVYRLEVRTADPGERLSAVVSFRVK
jgi:penicillin-binding protein 1C